MCCLNKAGSSLRWCGKRSTMESSRSVSQVEQCKEPPYSNTFRKGIGMTVSKPHLCFKRFCKPFSWASTITLPGPMTRIFMLSHFELWEKAGRSGLSGCPQSTNSQPFCFQNSASLSAIGRSGLVRTKCGPSTIKVQSMCEGARS